MAKKTVGKIKESIKDIQSVERYLDFSIRGNAHQIKSDDPDFSTMLNDYSVYLTDKEFLQKWAEKLIGKGATIEKYFDVNEDGDFDEFGGMEEFRVTEEYYITFKDDSEISVDWSVPDGNFLSADSRDAEAGTMANKYIREYEMDGWDIDIDSLAKEVGGKKVMATGGDTKKNREEIYADLEKQYAQIVEDEIGFPKEFKSHAGRQDNNFGGTLIILNSAGDSAVVWNDWADSAVSSKLELVQVDSWSNLETKGIEKPEIEEGEDDEPTGFIYEGQFNSLNDFMRSGYAKGGSTAKKGAVNKYEFYNGDVVWDTSNKTYGVVLNNFDDAINGDSGDVRLDSDGMQSIYKYDEKWEKRIGYNLVPYGSKEDKGDGDLSSLKKSGKGLIDSNKDYDTARYKYYSLIYCRLLSGEFDDKKSSGGLMAKGGKITAKDAGNWVDGSRGIYQGEMIIEIAEKHGFLVDEKDVANKKADGEHYHDLIEEATQYLNDQAPEGYYFGNSDSNSDFGLWKSDEMGKGGLTPAKARQILHDGEAHGKKLTDKQRKYMGAVASGYAKKSKGGDVSALDGTKKYNYGITFRTITEESAQQSDWAKTGWEIEKEDSELQDIIKTASWDYGINGFTGNGWESTSPTSDRDYFEKGIEKYYDLHITHVDGSSLSKEEEKAITELLKSNKVKYDEDEKSWYGKGGKAGDMNYEKDILPILAEAVKTAWKPIAKKYHLYEEQASEIESKSGSGFIAFTDGGYTIHGFNPLTEYDATGVAFPEKSQKQIDKWIKECYDDTLKEHDDEESEEFKDAVSECIGGIAVDFDLRAVYYKPDNRRNEFKGKNAIYVFGIINEDLKDRKDMIEEGFSFDSISELKEKLPIAINKVLTWYKVDDKMARGGKAGRSSSVSDINWLITG